MMAYAAVMVRGPEPHRKRGLPESLECEQKHAQPGGDAGQQQADAVGMTAATEINFVVQRVTHVSLQMNRLLLTQL
jgi:hypothetical protein